jgi:hypothetical protein
LRLALVRRPWIVNAAQDATIHQVSRWLFNFTITFFAARHEIAPAFSYRVLAISSLGRRQAAC